MIDLRKTNRFRTFRKKYRKDEATQEILDYISFLQEQIIELEKKMVNSQSVEEN